MTVTYQEGLENEASYLNEKLENLAGINLVSEASQGGKPIFYSLLPIFKWMGSKRRPTGWKWAKMVLSLPVEMQPAYFMVFRACWPYWALRFTWIRSSLWKCPLCASMMRPGLVSEACTWTWPEIFKARKP